MKILHLTLKKQWFDMILSGEKKEEYREAKPYWRTRLNIEIHEGPAHGKKGIHVVNRSDFDVIVFRHGYTKDAPVMTVRCLGIKHDTGKPEWGAAPRTKYFVISLGKILSTKNI